MEISFYPKHNFWRYSKLIILKTPAGSPFDPVTQSPLVHTNDPDSAFLRIWFWCWGISGSGVLGRITFSKKVGKTVSPHKTTAAPDCSGTKEPVSDWAKFFTFLPLLHGALLLTNLPPTTGEQEGSHESQRLDALYWAKGVETWG